MARKATSDQRAGGIPCDGKLHLIGFVYHGGSLAVAWIDGKRHVMPQEERLAIERAPAQVERAS